MKTHTPNVGCHICDGWLCSKERPHAKATEAPDRAAAIAALGMKPEPVPCPPGERYAATTTELVNLVRRLKSEAA